MLLLLGRKQACLISRAASGSGGSILGTQKLGTGRCNIGASRLKTWKYGFGDFGVDNSIILQRARRDSSSSSSSSGLQNPSSEISLHLKPGHLRNRPKHNYYARIQTQVNGYIGFIVSLVPGPGCGSCRLPNVQLLLEMLKLKTWRFFPSRTAEDLCPLARLNTRFVVFQQNSRISQSPVF